jgi:hypothetical protein
MYYVIAFNGMCRRDRRGIAADGAAAGALGAAQLPGSRRSRGSRRRG